MKKIGFINIYDYLKTTGFEPPLGLVSLCEVLEREHVDSEIVDFQYLYYKKQFSYSENINKYVEDMVKYIVRKKFGIISFYTMCNNIHIVLEVASFIKMACPEILIGLGGPQATLTAEEIMKEYSYIDFIGLGEGEKTIVDIYRFLNAGKAKWDYKEVKGLIYRKGEFLINGGEPELISDLNELPILNFTGFDLSIVDCLTLDVGRGCPFYCSFCSTQKFWKRKYRLKDPVRIVDEMEFYHNKYGINNFSLQHDMFTADKEKVTLFCRTLLERKLNIKWTCSSRVDVLENELVDRMVQAGCMGMFIGIETGSMRMQKIIHKNLELRGITDKLKQFSKLGLNMVLSFMYGFPEETEDDLEETLQLIYNLSMGIPKLCSHIQMHKLSFLPGTEITNKYFDSLEYDANQNFTMNYSNNRIFTKENISKEVFPHFYEVHTKVRDEYKDMDLFLCFFLLRSLEPYMATYRLLLEIRHIKIISLYLEYMKYVKKSCFFQTQSFYNIQDVDKLQILNEFYNFIISSNLSNEIKYVVSIEHQIIRFMYHENTRSKVIAINVDYLMIRNKKVISEDNILRLTKIKGSKIQIKQINIFNLIKEVKSLFYNVQMFDSHFFIQAYKGKMYVISQDDYESLKPFFQISLENAIVYLMKNAELVYTLEKILIYHREDMETKGKKIVDQKRQIALFSKLQMEYPAIISMQITSRCNLHCRHCYNCSGEANLDLPYNDIIRTIDWMHQNNILSLGLTGGEAVLYPQIFDVITYASSKRMIVSLNSNGYAMTKSTIIKLVKSGLQKLYISIDGGANIHNDIRGKKDSYEKAIEAIKMALQEKLECEIFFTCSSLNFDNVIEVISIGKEFSVPVNILRFHRLGRGANGNIQELEPAQIQKLIHTVKENRDVVMLDKCYLYDERESNCKICHKSIMTINYNGDVYLCPYMQCKNLSIGNLQKDTFETIMNRRKNHPYFRMQSTDFDEPCKSCEDFPVCYGGCRAGYEYIPDKKFKADSLCERIPR